MEGTDHWFVAIPHGLGDWHRKAPEGEYVQRRDHIVRKRVLTLLLCAAMLFGMVPNVVAAEAPAAIGTEPAAEEVYATQDSTSPEEWVPADISTDEGIDSDPRITLAWETGSAEWKNNSWSSALPGGVTYAADTHTLTLNGANLSSLVLKDFGDIPVVVQVLGENTIKSSMDADSKYPCQLEIIRCNNVTFSGGGSLSITKEFTGDPNIFDSTDQMMEARPTFIVQDTYSLDLDTAVLATGPSSKLCFDKVNITIEDQFQQAELHLYHEYDNEGILNFETAWIAQVVFGNIAFVNNATMTINGQRASIIDGNVTIDESSSLTTTSVAFRSHIATDSSIVTVKGELHASGTPLKAGNALVEIAEAAHSDYKISAMGPTDAALRVGEGVTLQIDGGSVSAASNLYTPYGLQVQGSAVIQSGQLTVSQETTGIEGENVSPETLPSGIILQGGTFRQPGSSA